MKDLVRVDGIKKKLKKDTQNKVLFADIIKRVTMKDSQGDLILKKEYK